MKHSGFSVVELTIVMIVTASLVAIGVATLQGFRERAALDGAADTVARQLDLTRALAVARRETVRLTRRDAGLAVVDAGDRVVATLGVGRGEDLAVDSVRVRPASIRFNARGQAGPGSVYVWRGDRGVRLIVNFLGRVRRETLP